MPNCSTVYFFIVSQDQDGVRGDAYDHPHGLGQFSDMGKANKSLWEKFMAYYEAVFAEGALTEREKALIALAVTHKRRWKRGRSGRDDRSSPRALRNSRRGIACSWCADA